MMSEVDSILASLDEEVYELKLENKRLRDAVVAHRDSFNLLIDVLNISSISSSSARTARRLIRLLNELD